jgi:hypothetical protein
MRRAAQISCAGMNPRAAVTTCRDWAVAPLAGAHIVTASRRSTNSREPRSSAAVGSPAAWSSVVARTRIANAAGGLLARQRRHIEVGGDRLVQFAAVGYTAMTGATAKPIGASSAGGRLTIASAPGRAASPTCAHAVLDQRDNLATATQPRHRIRGHMDFAAVRADDPHRAPRRSHTNRLQADLIAADEADVVARLLGPLVAGRQEDAIHAVARREEGAGAVDHGGRPTTPLGRVWGGRGMPAAASNVALPFSLFPCRWWGKKWGTKPHVAQPISAKRDFAKTA